MALLSSPHPNCGKQSLLALKIPACLGFLKLILNSFKCNELFKESMLATCPSYLFLNRPEFDMDVKVIAFLRWVSVCDGFLSLSPSVFLSAAETKNCCIYLLLTSASKYPLAPAFFS